MKYLSRLTFQMIVVVVTISILLSKVTGLRLANTPCRKDLLSGSTSRRPFSIRTWGDSAAHNKPNGLPFFLASPRIELQSDAEFGRGDSHLSATLEENDVVAYRAGTWTVDGVEVGDGSPSRLLLAKVDNLQIVWTHNCEHGCVRGHALELDVDCSGTSSNKVGSPSDSEKIVRYSRVADAEYMDIEIGPEQIVAKIPVAWKDGIGRLLAPLSLDLLSEIGSNES